MSRFFCHRLESLVSKLLLNVSQNKGVISTAVVLVEFTFPCINFLFNRNNHRWCSIEKGVFGNFSQINRKTTLVWGLQFYWNGHSAQMFSCEFRETFKNTFLTEHFQASMLLIQIDQGAVIFYSRGNFEKETVPCMLLF